MNGLADWPHFYLNVAEVGIIIGGRGRATLFPLIDVLFSTLARSLARRSDTPRKQREGERAHNPSSPTPAAAAAQEMHLHSGETS